MISLPSLNAAIGPSMSGLRIGRRRGLGGRFYRLSSGAASSEICIISDISTKRVPFPIRSISRFSFSPVNRAAAWGSPRWPMPAKLSLSGGGKYDPSQISDIKWRVFY
jgi:hypothetical protein